MSSGDKIWIGADPGGKSNFGLAILNADGSGRSWCVDCADEAMQVIVEHTSSSPAGVGVDAPLWWSSGHSSDRQSDQWLRKRYGFSGGQVQTSNSLRGAALVQAAMFAQRIRERFPDVGITETHPKAVWKALDVKSWDGFVNLFSLSMEIRAQEHERDAVISAVAARKGLNKGGLTISAVVAIPANRTPLPIGSRQFITFGRNNNGISNCRHIY